MANKQTKNYRKSNLSTLNQGDHPGFKSFDKPPCPSKRGKKWGLGLPDSKREIVYMEEHKNRRSH